jgi:hypothetical protein
MKVSAHPEASGSPVPEAVDDRLANPPDPAARLLGRLSVLPALLVAAWLVAGLPLLLAGHFQLVPMLVISLPLAAVFVVLGLRWTPGRTHIALPVRSPDQARTPWWAVAGVLAVAVAFGIDQLIYHSEFLIVTRDPASYVNFGYWIAHHGSLPIPQDASAFGGTYHGALTFQSFAFYQVGNSVVPQFMAGLPMVLSAAIWLGGLKFALVMPPLLGACGVLAFGGLVSRLVGPRWAPLGALVLALSMPEQFTSRSAYSEPLTQILFLGGLCLVIDALNSDGVAARTIAALGGLALGLTLLVRIDGASDVLPLVPYCGLLFLGRHRQAFPMAAGLVVGALYGGLDGYVLSRPYVDSISSSLGPLGLAAGVVLIATVAAVVVLWRRGVPGVRWKWLPNAAAAVAVLVAVGFTVRPYVQTVRVNSGAAAEQVIAGFQAANHLPIDPTRTYWELSMDWVFWYVGVPAVVLATLGAALLARRCLLGAAAGTARGTLGRAQVWTLPLITFAWTIVTTLYHPAITADQPWASRRLVPAVLPGVILLAVWALSWLVWHLRGMDIHRAVYGGIVFCCLAALLLPAVITTFGLQVDRGGPVGIKLAATGTALEKTYAGELGAVNRMCRRIPHNSSVVILDSPTADRFTQIIRGICGDPAARVSAPTRPLMRQIVSGIVADGRQPVLVGSSTQQLAPYGGPIKRLMGVSTTVDPSTLTTPPTTPQPFTWGTWISEPRS